MNYGKIALALTPPALIFSYASFDLARNEKFDDAATVGAMALIIIGFQLSAAWKWSKRR